MRKIRSYILQWFRNGYKKILTIRPCPFCGSQKLYLMEYQALKTVYIRCYGCAAHSFPSDTAIRAIENWNKAASQ